MLTGNAQNNKSSKVQSMITCQQSRTLLMRKELNELMNNSTYGKYVSYFGPATQHRVSLTAFLGTRSI